MIKSLSLLLIILSQAVYSQEKPLIEYQFPINNSKRVSTHTTIIIRFYEIWYSQINLSTLEINVEGDKNGYYSGNIIIADDQRTIIFKPDFPFSAGEFIRVGLSCNIPELEKGIYFQFTTAHTMVENPPLVECEAGGPDLKNERHESYSLNGTTLINGVPVPSDFPNVEIEISENTAPGKIFMATWVRSGYPYLLILNNDGTPDFYRRLPANPFDFKLHTNSGTLTYFISTELGALELDSNYVAVDTLHVGHNYRNDAHDIQIMPDGNYYMIGMNWHTVDMTDSVEGGRSNATVKGNAVQELDRQNNVVWEWRSWDHFSILDAVHENLTASYIDYVHMNAIAIDYDGHVLISSRNLSEVTKINRQTGDIIWRLGGVNNQFEWINDELADSIGISYQHDIRPVSGKPDHYTIFDNGRYHSPRISRAFEFKVDTTNMTVEIVWQYRYSPDLFAVFMGNTQRLSNGNTFITWSVDNLPKITEVTAENEIVYELGFAEPTGCYRAFRFNWEGKARAPYLITESHTDRVSLIFNKFGDKIVSTYHIYGGTDPSPDQLLASTSVPYIDLTQLENDQTYYFRVIAVDSNGFESEFSNEEEVHTHFVSSGSNMLFNGDFSDESNSWHFETSEGAVATGSVEDSIYQIYIDAAGSDYRDIQLYQGYLELLQRGKYKFEFDAWSANPTFIEAKVEKSIAPFTDYSNIGISYITEDSERFTYEFTMEEGGDLGARVVFNCGNSIDALFIDNVSLTLLEINPIEDNKNDVKHFRLSANYPNPFNATTVIEYEIPQKSHVTIKIYNILGELVENPVDYVHERGMYHIGFDASGFSSGIYFYTLEARIPGRQLLFRKVKKMIMIK